MSAVIFIIAPTPIVVIGFIIIFIIYYTQFIKLNFTTVEEMHIEDFDTGNKIFVVWNQVGKGWDFKCLRFHWG